MHVVAEDRVEHAPLAVIEHKSHRIDLAVDRRSRSRDRMNGSVAGQARVELVRGLERRQGFRNRMLWIGNLHLEGTMGVVRPRLRIIDSADNRSKLWPVLPCAARKV